MGLFGEEDCPISCLFSCLLALPTSAAALPQPPAPYPTCSWGSTEEVWGTSNFLGVCEGGG